MRSLVAFSVALLLAPVTAVSPTLSLNATLIRHLDWVRVTVTGVAADTKEVWLGVFSPADAPVDAISPLASPATAPWTATSPIKYTPFLNLSAAGEATYNFELINMYENVSVHLFSHGINTPVHLASSPTISFIDAPPLRVHLARTTDATEMRVVWHSDLTVRDPVVRWGAASGVFTHTAVASTRTYTMADMCGAPANITFGFFPPHAWHSAVMTGLTPGARVFYTVGSASGAMTAETTFFAAVAPGVSADTLHVLALADWGVTELDGTLDHWPESSAVDTLRSLEDRVNEGVHGSNYTLALHVGDIAYSTGHESKWELFASRLVGVADRVPYMVSFGNHESDFIGAADSAYLNSTDSGGECGLSTYIRFPMPAATQSSDYLGFYSFSQGPATFITLNSELRVDEASEQYAWFERALAAVNRTLTPWLVVQFHRPIYYTQDKNPWDMPPLFNPHFATPLEPLMLKYEVDLHLSGHVHNTIVTCAVYNQTCVTPKSPGAYDAPVYALIGNAGKALTPLGPTPQWLRYNASAFGYATLHFNATTLHGALHLTEPKDKIHYDFWITRTYPRT